MEPVRTIRTIRVGQLTGSTNEGHRDPVDAEGWPLLQETTSWGVQGLDLGALAEHRDDGRLYIFFGDVATHQRQGDPPQNSDLVAWTDDREVLHHGAHLAIGWEFVLPFKPTAIGGQDRWQFCLKCAALFWNGDSSFKGVCPAGGVHDTFGLGLDFVIPFEPTGVAGQPDWHFCGNCGCMFWDGDGPGRCPAGDFHVARGWRFVLPVKPDAPQPPPEGQPLWRFCAHCHGLFWNGYPHKGVCAGAPGGGFKLHPVLRTSDGQFDPFRGPPPINETRSLETPNGAFRHGERMYVFAGIADARFTHEPRRQDDPANGDYLFSKQDPSREGAYDVEFLFSPKLGWCATDESRSSFLGHHVLGWAFVLPSDPPPTPGPWEGGWRSCRKCEALFWDGDTEFKGVCQRGGPHEADPAYPALYALEFGLPEDGTHQAKWRRCANCQSLYWNGRAPDTGLCPAGGRHAPTGPDLRVPRVPIEQHHQHPPHWRFCTRCHGMVRTDQRHCFPWLAPVRVSNVRHEILHRLSRDGDGLLMIGFDWREFRLAWMPLIEGQPPRFDTTRYYHAGKDEWSNVPDNSPGYGLFGHPFAESYTHVSAHWFEDPGYWVVAYGTAWDEQKRFTTPVQARFSRNLREWSEPIPLFDPANAYGRFMHWPGGDDIHPRIPPAQPPGKDNPGWAYGAFLIGRFSGFDPARRVFDLHYLLSTSSPYQVHLMHSAVRFAERDGYSRIVYGGNGTTPVDSGLPLVGTFYGVARNGDLHWYRYTGAGAHDPNGVAGWHPNSGNPIGNGWDGFIHLLGCGDGILLGVLPNGDLLWYAYEGNGEADASGGTGWHLNSRNPIGNGWHGFRDLIVLPQSGRPSNRLKILAVARNGDLLWCSYEGNGESDISGVSGWHPNSGNPIGNGWHGFRHLHGSGNVVFAVRENGDLLWHAYEGMGESDVTGATGWHPNSGNPIGNGWQNFRHIFGGVTDVGGFGHVIYTVTQTGELLWHRYEGQGEADVSGTTGWHPNSGSVIDRVW